MKRRVTHLSKLSKEEIKKLLYEERHKMTGRTLKWGTLTGVKPLKLYNKLLDKNNGDHKAVRNILATDYLVEKEKIDLLREIHEVQSMTVGKPRIGEVSIYIGIPFCPTRCAYCSFTSNQKDESEIKRYLDALYKEFDYISGEMIKLGLKAETVYIGGGTPTTLNACELEKLTAKINNDIPTVDNFEFTVEAGRPDTITAEKLEVMKRNGVKRISVNPQTMKEDTLKIIGRDHTVSNTINAFQSVEKMGFYAVNADLIAGLPGEREDDFSQTLNQLAKFSPENVTIHTLALKKSSKLMEQFMDEGKTPFMDDEEIASHMVGNAENFLKKNGYQPYYIYRQKYMADNLENVGYAKAGTECIYNIRIMEEKQTVIAMGAGGSSKVFFPEEDRLERVMNVSNYEIYIDRIEEMIDRKRTKLFNCIITK